MVNNVKNNWQRMILNKFPSKDIRSLVAFDPDNLLLEESVLADLKAKGFELLHYEDNVSFRFAYETRFRRLFDLNSPTESSVIIHFNATEEDIPYDLKTNLYNIFINLNDLFPNISYAVIKTLHQEDLDALWEAQEREMPGRLGENESKDFVLRHVYKIAQETIKTPSDLLKLLLRLHYRGQLLPPVFGKRLEFLLNQNGNFDKWPLEQLLTNKQAFLEFLQERWPVFINSITASNLSTADTATLVQYNFKHSGPELLPFDDKDVRVFIDAMFTEGILAPIEAPALLDSIDSWICAGIKNHKISQKINRLQKLLDAADQELPADNSRYGDWLRFSKTWGELTAAFFNFEIAETPTKEAITYNQLQKKVDSCFFSWIKKSYPGLYNQAASAPVMMHHIPRTLSRLIETNQLNKIALLVIDGLSINQWIVIKNTLTEKLPQLKIQDSSCFAWLPTITTISRQAIFSGKAPLYFPDSIGNTSKEESLWTQFWLDLGLSGNQVSYLKITGSHDFNSFATLAHNSSVKILGIVLTEVDEIMHGVTLGAIGMQANIIQWAKQPLLGDVIKLLKDRGFTIFITSDHGNIEAEGVGRPREGALAQSRGERVRLYDDARLRARVKNDFPDAIELPGTGLPANIFPLYAPARCAFVPRHTKVVTHGGFALEELIVPWIRID